MTLHRFAWCQDAVDEVHELLALGNSFGAIATIMQERGTFMTRGAVAGLVYRERMGALKTGPRRRSTDTTGSDTAAR